LFYPDFITASKNPRMSQLWLDNESGMDGLTSAVSRVTSAISGLSNAFLGQTRSKARLNAIASYDQSNELFKVYFEFDHRNRITLIFLQAFLSNEMMYSCALWSEAEGGVCGDLTSGRFPGDLEAAQLRKIRYVLTKAKVKSGDRILEFGSGWGGMAIEVMPHFLFIMTYLITGAHSGCANIWL
jgi:cyclopropane-fatty-acyl-phospholipid synthase